MIHVRSYAPAFDEPCLLDLWDRALGAGIADAPWPLTPTWFRAVALNPGNNQDHLLAEIDGQVVGFALIHVKMSNPPYGSLLALAVHPGYRRCGVGRMLYFAALERLRERGVQQIQLGAGAHNYFWPGVPTNIPGAWTFFQALGWPEVERSYDLTRSLDEYQTPTWVWERVCELGVDFVTAGDAGLERAVVDFVLTEYLGWASFFDQSIHEGRARDVLLARQTGSGEILGACLVESPVQRWVQRLPQPVGALGCVLTARAVRDRGIGLALTARATEILQARGCRTSFIGWTWLVDWYSKLGYTTWQEYIMSWMDLEVKNNY